MATVVRMPEVLANVTEAAIQSWLVRAGQTVSVGAPLAEVETEKAVVEYAAEIEGTVLQLLVSEGQAVAVGEPIALIGAPGEQTDVPSTDDPGTVASPEPETAPDQAASPVAEAPVVLPAEEPHAPSARLFASPIVRRLARERGIDLARISGSGPGGRIVRVDLDRRVEPPSPAPAAPAAAEATARPLNGFADEPPTRMRSAIARRLTESKSTVPHFYMKADCRVEALLELRAAVNATEGARVSVNDFVLKAFAGALAAVPSANAIWTEGVIRRFEAVDLGVAVAIEGGLLTPVVRGVESCPFVHSPL